MGAVAEFEVGVAAGGRPRVDQHAGGVVTGGPRLSLEQGLERRIEALLAGVTTLGGVVQVAEVGLEVVPEGRQSRSPVVRLVEAVLMVQGRRPGGHKHAPSAVEGTLPYNSRVSPGCMVMTSQLSSRSRTSDSNRSGVPVSAGKVPQ